MDICVQQYNETRIDYEKDWATLNETLYNLCKRFPDHQRRDGVNAKLWVIGRTYATGVERMIPTRHIQGSSMTQLADYLWANRTEVDQSLCSLTRLREPLTPDTLIVILTVHGKLHNLIRKILRKQRSPRSFVSKLSAFSLPGSPNLRQHRKGQPV